MPTVKTNSSYFNTASITTLTYTPMSFPGYVANSCKFWIDASDSSTTFQESTGASATTAAVNHGDLVGTIRDKSGNSRHLVAESDTYRVYLNKQNSTGRAVVGKGENWPTDGIFPRLYVPSSTSYFKFMHSTQATIFIICRWNLSTTHPNSGWVTPMFATTNGGGPGISATFTSQYGANRINTDLNTAGSAQYVSRALSGNNYGYFKNFMLFTVRADVNNVTENQRLKTYVNGTNELLGSGSLSPTTANSNNNLYVGGYSPAAGLSIMDTAEMIIYDALLDDTQKGYVEAYLMSKWLRQDNKNNTDDYVMSNNLTNLTDDSGNELFWR